jgi:hypothetical protein
VEIFNCIANKNRNQTTSRGTKRYAFIIHSFSEAFTMTVSVVCMYVCVYLLSSGIIGKLLQNTSPHLLQFVIMIDARKNTHTYTYMDLEEFSVWQNWLPNLGNVV